jgi:hypothetical protein
VTPVVLSRAEILRQLLAKAEVTPYDDRIGHAYKWTEADGREKQIKEQKR